MNTIFAQRRARLLEMKALRDNYLPPDQTVRCPGCGAFLFLSASLPPFRPGKKPLRRKTPRIAVDRKEHFP